MPDKARGAAAIGAEVELAALLPHADRADLVALVIVQAQGPIRTVDLAGEEGIPPVLRRQRGSEAVMVGLRESVVPQPVSSGSQVKRQDGAVSGKTSSARWPEMR